MAAEVYIREDDFSGAIYSALITAGVKGFRSAVVDRAIEADAPMAANLVTNADNVGSDRLAELLRQQGLTPVFNNR